MSNNKIIDIYVLLSAATLPVFVQGIKNVETIEGKRIEFECVVEATPKPDIAW